MINTVQVLMVGLQSSLARELSLNTDIFDTNLINLGIVIGVLVYFGRKIVQDTLNSRKAAIITQIEDAKERYEQVQQKLLKAQEALAQAKIKDKEIRANGELEKKRQIQLLIEGHEENKRRLLSFKESTIQLERKKAVQHLRTYIITSAVKQAEEFLKNNITPEMHIRINDYQLGILKFVKPAK